MHVDCFLVDAPDDWEPQLDHEHDGYRWHTAEDAPGALFWDRHGGRTAAAAARAP
jgi:hypothetical protein